MAALGWLLNLGFAASGAATPAPAVTPTGGGIGKRRRYSRYPRRVMVEGRLFTVRTADEERQLLQAMLERATLAQEYADAVGDAPAEERARKRIARIQRGLKAAGEARRAWIERLLAEDEEIILAVMH